MTYQVEVTDTFGGESNYSWVRRTTIDVPAALPHHNAQQDQQRTRRSLVRQAKAFAGYTGHRCAVSDYGDMIEIRPRGICQVCFVTWIDS